MMWSALPASTAALLSVTAMTMPSRAHLLHVRQHPVEVAVARREGDHRELLGDQRDRAVLHLAARVAFRVDVRDLLQLERALERDGVLEPAAEVEEVARDRELL